MEEDSNSKEVMVSTALVNHSNLSGYVASSPAPAKGPSLTIPGSAPHLSGPSPPRSLAAMWLSRHPPR